MFYNDLTSYLNYILRKITISFAPGFNNESADDTGRDNQSQET